jgi:HD-GYP domain-containing protein (c-di-GMP phosphodiesterase class II)
MNQNPFDPPNPAGRRPSPLAGFGPRTLRARMLLLFGAMMAAYVLLSHLLYRSSAAFVLVSLGFFLLGIVLVFLVSGLITRPIVQLTRTAERLAGGDLRQRARVYGRDETGVLARTFNGMLDGLERISRDLESRNRNLEQEAAKRAVEKNKDTAERVRIERELRLARIEIDQFVDKRTEELARVNDELHGKVLETRRSEDFLQNTLDRLERSLEATFRAMATTLELRDPYMAGHQQRVAGLAVSIAQEMNLSWEKIEGLRFAGVIHDIGKITAPVEITAKPGRLSNSELQIIKDHPRIGYDMIKDIAFPWPVAHIILQHHERIDGSGYPEGLAGDAILIEARILAVADVVEAICSLRPYRPALGTEKALEEIRKGRGFRYDARAVDACLRLFREGRFSFKKATENAAPLALT